MEDPGTFSFLVTFVTGPSYVERGYGKILAGQMLSASIDLWLKVACASRVVLSCGRQP